jgi:hypothetical protein
MYVRWTTYRCPSCNARTGTRMISSPRVGVEYKKCGKCGASYRTPDVEWPHMTTGQRLGYFLNEWTVALLGILLVVAGAIVYADRSEWQTSVWLVLGGIACCLPFWLWKSFAVRRSIERTNTANATLNFGNIEGLDNVAHAGSLSTQPATYTPPPAQAPKRGFGIGWKIRLVIIAIALLFGVLDSEWKTVDKYFPALNKLLHSGTPTSEGDMDYLIAHLQEDEKKLSQACEKKMEFKECRQHLLAAKPALTDLHDRIQALSEAWTKEKSERAVPSTCLTRMDEFLRVYGRYLAAKDKLFAQLQAMDTPEHITASKASFAEAAEQEDAAVNALHEASVGNACDGY